MPHATAAILSTGDELVLGQLQDTNAQFIAQALTDRGIRVVEIAAVGDDLSTLITTITRLASSVDLLVMTGGLGPTDGDLTRPALCAATADTLVDDEFQAQELSEKLAKRSRQVTPRQLRQAQRPSRAACLPNPMGTAPGLRTTFTRSGSRSCEVFALPGPPNELMPMWTASIEPALRPTRTVLTRLGFVLGLAEADCAARLGAMTARDRTPLLGMTASGGIITLRHRCEGLDPMTAIIKLTEDHAQTRVALGPHLFAIGPTDDLPAHTPSITVLASALLSTLKARGETLGLAESCTGGMLGATLTAVPGASAALMGGMITYHNTLKTEFLGVRDDDITRHGAVSDVVAEAMAVGALHTTGANWALAITGIAGPDGGTGDKPVGTVWISLARLGSNESVILDTRRYLFTGNREDVRERACVCAMGMLWFVIAAEQQPAASAVRLGWEVERLTSSSS